MSDRFDHTLEHTLDTKADADAEAGVTAVRRIEVITGTGRRRPWSQNDKARIVIESLKPGVNVSEVARRNGLSPQQLFGWRREARALMAESVGVNVIAAPAPAAPSTSSRRRSGSKAREGERARSEHVPAFAPVVVATCSAAPPAPPASPPTGSIEIAIGDAVVRVVGQVEPAALTAVLRAIRRTS